MSPISGNIIRTVISQPSANQPSELQPPAENQFVAFKGRGVSLGANQASALQPPQSQQPPRMPEITIENTTYQELRDEDTSQTDIENQRKIMDLIKQKQQEQNQNNNS